MTLISKLLLHIAIMSGQSIVTIELGRSDKTGNNSVGAGAGAGAPEPEAAVADYRTQSTTTRYNTDCKDLALQSLKCQEKLQAGTSRNPCAGQ